VVLQTQRPDSESVRRRSTRYLAWAGTATLGLVAAAGLVAGTTAVWSAFDPGTPGQSPAPLWFPPPATVQPKVASATTTAPEAESTTAPTSPTAAPTTADDHGGRDGRTATPIPGSTSRTTEPGDDKGGDRGGDNSSGKGKLSDGKSDSSKGRG
jgi:hypothetical protein